MKLLRKPSHSARDGKNGVVLVVKYCTVVARDLVQSWGGRNSEPLNSISKCNSAKEEPTTVSNEA